jgi:hypothetical protein
MTITLSQDVAAQIRDALVAALHSRGGDLEQEGKPLGQTKREQAARRTTGISCPRQGFAGHASPLPCQPRGSAEPGTGTRS